ncbi:MAG: hypothetical protein ABSG48_06335, partial [Geobacteraceae bacterium]
MKNKQRSDVYRSVVFLSERLKAEWTFTDRAREISAIVGRFTLLQLIRQCFFLAGLAHSRHRLDSEPVRDAQCRLRTVVIEPLHTVDDVSFERALQSEI